MHTSRSYESYLLFLMAFIGLCLLCISGCLSKVERVCKTTQDCTGFPEPRVCFNAQCVRQVCDIQKGAQPCHPDCKTGQIQACTLKGMCKKGVRFCIQAGAKWSACFGASVAKPEICDGKDNNCNGQIDEGKSCSCTPHATRACYTGDASKELKEKSTLCHKGMQTCIQKNGTWSWGTCTFESKPSQWGMKALNTCHIVDRDCDGNIDPDTIPTCTCSKKGATRSCHPQDVQASQSLCQLPGKQTCTMTTNGTLQWGRCVGAVTAHSEEEEPCNGKDDDCDGHIDNRTGTTLPMWKACEKTCTISLCINKTWTLCAQREMCGSQQDEDCDGQIDESDCVRK